MNILKENERRQKQLFEPYNPLTGEGSKIERFPYFISANQKTPIFLPVSMKQLPYLKGFLQNEIEQAKFLDDRLNHDFEFWCYVCITILDKESSMPIPFKLNRPQRILLKELEDMRIAEKPIRAILTKARQWGGSTMIQFYMKWIQVRHKRNWNSAIVAEVESQSLNIRAMYARSITTYPKFIEELSFANFEGQTSVKTIPERGCVISIASMQKPNKIRSQDLKMAHLSEVGLWKKTEGKEPKDVIQSLLGTIPMQPYTVFILESTAKGTGNYFHLTWEASLKGENSYRPIFIPWHQIERYVEFFSNNEEKLSYYKTLSDYGKYLWNEGATLEGIKWYFSKLKEMENDTWRMQSEFPTTATEAFQSTGQRAFPPMYVQSIKSDCKTPMFVGEIYGAADFGKEALIDTHFQPSSTGKLRVWRMPNDPPVPDDSIMKERYVVILDVGGTGEKADYTAIRVFDRYWQSEGAMPEAIATWHGKLDADLAAWRAAQIAKFYDNALLIVEVNFLEKRDNDEGEAYYTVLDEISPHYSNVFSRTSPEQIKQGYPIKYGFHMNKFTKPEIVNFYKKILRIGGYIEYDQSVSAEADSFESQGYGRYGAKEGTHDDLLIVTMIGVWACYEHMSQPQLVKVKKPEIRKRGKEEIKGMASF